MSKSSQITKPKGFKAAAGKFGIKGSGAADMAMIYSESPAVAAAVMTRNSFCGPNITLNKEHLKHKSARAIICNAGNANAGTGSQGYIDAQTMAQLSAEALSCDPREVFVCSTGIIGVPLPMEKIARGIQTISSQLSNNRKSDQEVAQAILTTDLVTKAASKSFKIHGKTITLSGIAKGSGMIAPNMATMLAFITTDANISRSLLRKSLKAAVNADASFNRISVDSDTSTSDAVIILANAASETPAIKADSEEFAQFQKALDALCRDLAYQVIQDGEGVEHVIHIQVTGAKNDQQALTFAKSIADSPLIKTAFHGQDPNWGRIVMALGKTTLPLSINDIQIKLNRSIMFKNGLPTKINSEKVSASMKAFDQKLHVELGMGEGSCLYLGCDLSREYIRINADYHT